MREFDINYPFIKWMVRMNDEILRLEALKLAAQTLNPNSDDRGLIARADDIYVHIKTGKNEQDVVEEN